VNREARPRALVTGGAGFLGSHLCERLIAEGYLVLCVDNLSTGVRENVAHLEENPDFEYVHHDATRPLPKEGRLDEVYHFASRRVRKTSSVSPCRYSWRARWVPATPWMSR
jgi:nucleoside-diphosphate-sugar epimerase